MSWNGSIALTSGAAWSGSPQVITTRQYQSTNSATIGVFDAEILSTGAAVITSSNVLQTEINAIVAGGTTALWANYRAIANVDLSGHNLVNSKLLSTLDLQVSSINGTDIKLFGSTVVVGGVTIVNNTVKAGQVEKTTSVTDTINSVAGAIGSLVDVAQKAASGALADSGAILQQVYWGTAAVDSVVDLTNGVVTLATGIQGLTQSRQYNGITGGSVPGQTTNVYETINGTTQLQFSTLGTAVTTVFRTTDQINPNLKLGRELFISSIIPAGSKVVRSVSDPLSIAVISTQTLSTTNYLQSFGQWHAVLEPDYNLKVSSLQADTLFGFAYLSTSKISTINLETSNANVNNLLNATNLYVGAAATVVGGLTSGSLTTGALGAASVQATSLSSIGLNISSLNGVAVYNVLNPGVPTKIPYLSSLTLSTGSVQLSSINGQPISVYVNSGDVVFNSVSTLMISTGRALISSINDSIIFTNQPTGNSIDGIYTLTAAIGNFNTSLNTSGTLTAGPTIIDTTRVTGLFRVTGTGGANVATITTAGAITGTSLALGSGALTAGTGTYTGAVSANGITSSGAISGTNTLTITGGTTLTGGNIVDTIGGATANFTNLNGTNATITTGNITYVKTNSIDAGLGTLNLLYGQILFNGSPSLTQTVAPYFSSISISTGSLQVSSINGIAYTATPAAPLYLSSFTVSTGSLTAQDISTINIQGSNAFFNIATVSTLNASTLIVKNIIDTFVSTTTGEFDILTTSTLTASQITTNTIQTNNLTGLERLSLPNIVGNSYSVVYPTRGLSSYISSLSLQQSGFFNFETNAVPSPPGGIVYLNSVYATWVYPSLGPYFGSTNPLQQNVYIQPGYAGTPITGTLYFYGIGSAGFLVQFIQQGDGLILAATPFIVQPGYYVKIDYTYPSGYYQNATYTVTYQYQPIAGSATSTITSSKTDLITDVFETVLNTSNVYQNSGTTTSVLGNLALNVSTMAFGSNTTRNNLYPYQFNGALQAPTLSTTSVFLKSINGIQFADLQNQPVPYLSSFTVSTGSVTASSIQSIFISTGLINVSTINLIGQMNISTSLVLSNSSVFDITKIINITSTAFSTVSSFQNNILSYTYNATVGDETSFNIGTGYNIESNNVSQWASTILQGNNANAPMSIEIDNDPGSGFLGTGTFDVQRISIPGNTPYDISVQYSLGGTVIVDIGFTDYRLYRFTKSTAGSPISWTYVINPPTYQTVNNNVFQITQSLTDVSLYTTDNLNLIAGSIKLQGSVQFSNINATKGFFSTLNTTSLTATNITGTNITGTNLQFQSLSTTNLYAGYITTSSININTQQSTPMILGTYSNVYNVASYTSPPPQQLITTETDMVITSANPAFTYTGSGSQTITFDAGNRVYLNGVLQSSSWNFATLKVNSAGLTVNVSTIAGNSSNGNYYINEQIANFNVKGGLVFALYTSAAGFLGNVSGNSSLLWNGSDFTSASYVAFTGLTYQSRQQTLQSVSTITYNNNVLTTFSTPTLFINTNPASNSPTVFFNGKNIEVFSQRVNGFLVNAGNYGKGDAAATASYGGRTFPVSQYNCIVSQSGFNAYGEAALAVNEQVWQTYQDTNGNWAFHFYCTTATVPAAGTIDFYAIAAVTMIPYDLGHFSGFQNPDHLGEGNGGPPVFPAIQLSTIVASTITCLAQDNISFNASLGIPTFLGPGNIALNANSNIDLMANYDIIAGASHNISLTAANAIAITAPATQQISIYQTGASDITLFNNGDARMNARRTVDIAAQGNININCLSTQQVTINQTGGSDFVLFAGGDTRMNAYKNAYVQASSNIFISAVGGNIDINTGGGGSQYITLTNAGTAIQFAGPNIYFTTSSGGANFNLPVSIGTAYSLNLQDAPINNAKNIDFGSGVYIHRYTPGGYTNPFLDIQGAGGDGQVRLLNGSASVVLRGNGDLGIASPNQTYFDNGGFVQFNVDHIYIYHGYLVMNDNPIQLRNDQYHALAFGNSGTYNVGVNGPYLVGYNGGALGTSGTSFNDKSLEWSYNDVYIYKTLDMSNNNINNVSTINFTNNGVIQGTNDLYINASQLDIVGNGITLSAGTSGIDLAGSDIKEAHTITAHDTLLLKAGASTGDVVLQAPTGAIILSSITIANANLFMNNNSITAVDTFSRTLRGSQVNQPIIQYGTATGSGPTGSVTVVFPTAYTSATSYIATASMMDVDAAKMSVNRDSDSQITIYWDLAGFGTYTFGWNCMGT